MKRAEKTKVEIDSSKGTDLILSTTGVATVEHDEETHIQQGEAFLIDAENESYTVSTSGVLFLIREEA